MFAAVSLNAQVWNAVTPESVAQQNHREIDPDTGKAVTIIDAHGDVVAQKNTPTEVGDIKGLKIVLLDGAGDWEVMFPASEGEFTAQDGITYNKGYIQGGTNGMSGHLQHANGVSAHIELTPSVAGRVYVVAKYGRNKPIWAAKVPVQVIEDEELNYSNMVEFLIDGFSTATVDETSGAPVLETPAYIKDDGTGVQADVQAANDTYAALPLDVEPGYTYFFWVSGSKIKLTAIHFIASEEPVATVPQMQLHGSWVENWGGPVMDIAADNATASATVNLAAGSYEFGVKELDEAGAQAAWWSPTAGDTFTREANSVVLVKGGSKNAKLTASVAGNYKFVFSYATHTLTIEYPELPKYTLLVGVDNACKNMGTVSGGGIFYQGDVVTITATPNSGYHFVEWSDGNSIAARKIYLSSDTTLFATFAAGDMGGKCGNDLYWTWEDGALTITGTGEMDLDTHPAWWQYENLQITSVSMPEGMTSISSWAFYGQPIATITVPASVEKVGDRAFADNEQLTHFEYLGNNIQWETELEEYWDYLPLYGCRNLQYFRGNIVLGVYYSTDTIIVSNGDAFDDMYSATYVDNTNASDEELWGTDEGYAKAVRTLYLPAGLVEIGDYALFNARFLGGITIPEGVTRIGISAFEDCRSMDSVVFAGNNVQEIGAWAFYNCHNLSQITIPEGVEEIGTAAFYGCTFLSELTLPSTTKKIAQNGFALCSKLQTMYVNALVPPTIEAKTFEDVDRATPVFVPQGTLVRYQADPYWSEFFNMAEYEAPTGNLTPAANETNALRKVVRNGQVLILRGDKTYTVLGEMIQ